VTLSIIWYTDDSLPHTRVTQMISTISFCSCLCCSITIYYF